MGEHYLRTDGTRVMIGNDHLERVLALDGARLRTVGLINRRTGRSFSLEDARECILTFAHAPWRLDIPTWRFRLSSREGEVRHEQDEGYRAGYYLPQTSDAGWQEVENLYGPGPPLELMVWEGYAWFRCWVKLPAEIADQELVFTLGGHDALDWQQYRVYLNGQLLGSQVNPPGWHVPGQYALRPHMDAYRHLKFGADNLLAVQVRGLDRGLPSMIEAERDRYLLRSTLVDQFVTVGEPYLHISDFRLLDWEGRVTPERAVFLFRTVNEEHELEVTLRYELGADEFFLRKTIEVHNQGHQERLLLEIEVENLPLAAGASPGGQGVPVLIADELFLGLEHPAGVNRGEEGRVRLQHCPGARLGPDGKVISQSAVLGVGPAGKTREQFVRYLEKVGRRREALVSIYDPFGVWDYTNPNDPRYHAAEGMLLETLDFLARYRERGVEFDYYVVDVGWQDHASALTAFRADGFPDGPEKVIEQVEALGMKFGLWIATTWAPWSCGENPAVRDCFVPGTQGMTAHFCPAAEPYRTILRRALLHHIRENRARCIKLDTTRFYCNSHQHGHLPGRYSVEAQMNAVIDLIAEARRICPELFVILYWGYDSPWWALHGDTLFEGGLNLEASHVCNVPTARYRDSANVATDQHKHQARLVPPRVHDSLGVWIAETRWGNHMGCEGWRDAWVLDLGRGSLVNQFWGDLGLLDEGDVDFLARLWAFLRANWRLFSATRSILGDPWRGEVYGYASSWDTHSVVVLNNPRFSPERVTLKLDEILGQGEVKEVRARLLYPQVEELTCLDESLELELRPFEVLLLEVGPTLEALPAAWEAPPSTPRRIVPSRRLDLSLRPVTASYLEVPPWELEPEPQDWVARLMFLGAPPEGFPRRIWEGSLEMPALEEEMTLALTMRLRRKGCWWRHAAVHDLLRLRAQVEGKEVSHRQVIRHRNWPGCSWQVFLLSVPPSWSEVRLDMAVTACLPADVELIGEAWLFHEWWR